MEDGFPYMDSNIIDLCLLMSPSPIVAAEELQKLKSCLTSWGCFQLINHGMSTEFLDEVCNVSKKFFTLPSEEKEKYSKSPDNNYSQGYGSDYDPNKGFGKDYDLSNGFPANYRLALTIYPENDRRPDRWPENPYNLRDVLFEYTLNVKTAHDKILQAMAQSLNLKDNSFLDGCGENPEVVVRINYYPPSSLLDLMRKLSKHSDISATTFLLIDREIEALEVDKDGQWFKVPIIPEAIMVIVGDQLEIMSNGIFKSVEHRVTTNSEKDRVSIAMFFSPDAEKEVGPLKELVKNDQPPLYKTIKRYKNLVSDLEFFLKGGRKNIIK